eukprot:3634836-Prymnesium_polylepis.1
MNSCRPNDAPCRPGTRGAVFVLTCEPTRAPCATEYSRLHTLLIASDLFVPRSSRSEMRAPSSGSDQVGP